MQQLDVRIETKTEDNVFVHLIVSVQYFVLPEKTYDAFYKRLIKRIPLNDVSSAFVMEELKYTTALPLETVSGMG